MRNSDADECRLEIQWGGRLSWRLGATHWRVKGSGMFVLRDGSSRGASGGGGHIDKRRIIAVRGEQAHEVHGGVALIVRVQLSLSALLVITLQFLPPANAQ